MKVAFVQFGDSSVSKGGGYVAGSIINAGHQLDFLDTYLIKPDAIAEKVIKGDYGVLMLSAMTMDMPATIDLISKVKAKKDIPVLLGGIHPTIVGAKLLDEYPQIDYLCIGEGESMVAEFLRDFGKPEFFNIQNLAFRRDGKAMENPIRPPEALENLPPFPWHLYSRGRIVNGDGFLSVAATRGCPYRCTYCCNKIYLDLYGKNYLRKRPLDQAVSEMIFLKKRYRPRFFLLSDEMMLWEEDYAKDLFKAIKEQVGIPYGFMARVEHINEEVVKLAKETGCQYVGMGIECGDEKFRKEHLKRYMSNEQIVKAFRLLRAAGIFTTSYNMIGFPFDNDEELTKATIELNRQAQPDYVQATIFYPFPGTQLYDLCVEKNLIDPAKCISDYHSDTVLRGSSMAHRTTEIAEMFNSTWNWKNKWHNVDFWVYIFEYKVWSIWRELRPDERQS
jgi:radical SAM superfamily enzyme YgiQ (UPF0313 family)